MSERLLLDYLPPFLQEYSELAQTMQTEQPEIDTLWTSIKDVLKDQFVGDATKNGIYRWEKILEIITNESEPLEDRKFRVLVRLNEDLPYTLKALEQQLTSLCGEDGYTLSLNSNKYILSVEIKLKNKGRMTDIKDMLRRIAPANLIVDLELIYNRHSTAAQYTHAYLSERTHRQIREELLYI